MNSGHEKKQSVEAEECANGVCVLKSPRVDRSNQPRDHTLVPFGASWKFWELGASPSKDWVQVEFHDEQWHSASAPFLHGSREEGTRVRIENRSSLEPVYFRHTFVLDRIPDAQWLRLAVHRAGGVVVHLNAGEVARDNVSEQSHESPSTSRPSQTAECPLQFTVPTDYLNTGKNVIAVEVRPYRRLISFDLSLCQGNQVVLRTPTYPVVPANLITAGTPCPDVEWQLVGSRERKSISCFLGQKVIVEMMGLSCLPCWESLPKLQQWAKSLEDSGVTVAAIVIDADISHLESVAKNAVQSFPNILLGSEVLAGDFFATAAYRNIGVKATPSMLLIDEIGVLQASCEGTSGPEFDAFLERAKAEGVHLPNLPEGNNSQCYFDKDGEIRFS